MTKHTKHILNHSMSVVEAKNFWTDDFREEFSPNRKKLFKAHKVPKFKKRFQISGGSS